MLVQDVIARFLEWRPMQGRYSSSTEGDTRSRLRSFRFHFRDRYIHEIQPGDIMKFLAEHVSAGTRLKYYNKIRPVFRLAKANRFLAIDPFDSIDAPATEYHEITIYTAEELERMLAVAEESYSDLVPFLALVSFGFLRSEELIARTTNETVLDWSAFDAEDRQIFVPHAVAKRSKTLTGNERAIPYNDALEHWLKPYIKQSGRIVQREKIAAYRALRKIRHRAQARDLQNGLRHSCLTYWMAANGEESMGTVARWSGNSPAVAKRHYVTAVKRSLGEKWFGIRRDGGEPEPAAPSHGIYTGDSTTLLGRPDKQV